MITTKVNSRPPWKPDACFPRYTDANEALGLGVGGIVDVEDEMEALTPPSVELPFGGIEYRMTRDGELAGDGGY